MGNGFLRRLRNGGNRPSQIKDSAAEVSLFRRRCFAAVALIVVLTGVLVARMVFLQVYQHELFATRSENNRVRVEPLPPTRGLIFDRNGELLAENRPTYNLMLTREQAGDVSRTVELLVEVLGLPSEMSETLLERSRQRQRPYQSALLLSDLSEGQIARLALNRYRLPGVEVEAQLLRYYPQSMVMSHVLGYVGRISQEDLERLDSSNYAGTHFVGKSGVERFYEDILHGQVGLRRVETNARGRVLGEIDRTAPIKGKDLTLTVDSGLQQLGAKLLDGRRGAIVAIEPKTGAILAMVSSPGFDANAFVTGISHADYQKLQNDKDLPLYSRAFRGEYPPASTVKPFMALAGLQSGVMRPGDTIFDPGYYQLPNDPHRYRNWQRWGHGRVDMHRALLVSNDTYFFGLAHSLGIDRISAFMHRFGYGENDALDVWGARSGLMPSRDWKRGRYNQAWYPGETLSAGIGQGYWLATPLQMASSAAVLANRGKSVRPHLVAAIGDQEILPPFPDSPEDVELDDPRWWDLVIQALKDVADTSAVLSQGRQYTLAAKTGTAQVFTVAQDARYDAAEVAERLRDHALFTGFAPVEDPEIAVSVIVENGGWGGRVAGPIGRAMIDAWMQPGADHEVKIPGRDDGHDL
ncbi:penicillin-binding protein 2 [Halotalea alkalilenta]|uniref:Peptidoglycan D,D-transpeptidase MrdA n=1 Tax=Halotalea alkalilenta TaxID=376489 RepID=A0A172YF98_9GAMM|nr:penicillin-binding protein 2 [Halotalea alkalilenta]ANF57877.1 penicillin-binding protein 2 [Halotalea alkalilenta]